MKKLCLLSVIVMGIPALKAEEAIQIATQFEQEKIEAIEAYLEENPEAKDRDTALRILVGSYLELGNYRPVPDLLLSRYELMPKREEVNFPLLIGEIARPLIEASISSDQRDKAKAFLTRVKSDYADTPTEAQILGILEQIGADLYLPGVGDTMDFAFTGLNEEDVDLSAMRDKVILVDFWATWCAPCLAALPHLLETYEAFQGDGFEVIGISLDENREELARFVEENSIPWPQYFDALGGDNELAQRFGIRKIPATFLVGKGGKIVAADLDGEELTAAIKKELAREL
ncbi:MAG: TlpA disulfide reductase family protein [Verrucomicrobiota bacterium]